MSSSTMVDNAMEDGIFQDAATALSQGKRHLMVRDYSSAVAALAEACSKLAEDHGDMSDELGEPFLLYGRALLGLSREEAGVLGTCMPENEEEEDDEEMDEDEEDQPAAEENEKKKQEEEKENTDKKDEKKIVDQKPVTEEEVEKKAEEKKPEENKSEEKKPEESKPEEKKPEANKPEEAKPEEKKVEDEKTDAQVESTSSAPSSSKASSSCDIANGGPSTSKQNGASENGEEDDGEDVDDEDEEVNSNLQVAWEVLELAKLILVKRGEAGWKLLAEAHRLLGEVAMESGNQIGALTDLTACLDLLRKLEPVDARSMAETHYQLGLAYSLGNEFDSSIEQFQEATSLLETRIKELQSLVGSSKTEEKSSDLENEIQELKELLPEIQDKITDMRDFKQQAAKKVIEDIKNRMASGSCSNGAGPSGEGSSSSTSASSSSSKPVSDISHLVRKKRKTEDEEIEATASPCKKPLTENPTS